MAQLASHLGPRDGFIAEAWGGGPDLPAGTPGYRIPLIHRDSPLLRLIRWHYRYHIEQVTAVLPAAWALRRRGIRIAFCADPSLAWNLKRLRHRHGAQVFFSDGMRLSPRWLQDYDGIHLLAPLYLEEARQAVRRERFNRFFAVPYFVETDRFPPPSEATRSVARTRLGIPADARVALSIGPVGTESSKRLDHVASELARTRSGRWMLVSVGADETGAESVRERCRAVLGDRVRFLGTRSRDALPEVFHTADIYALGALAEPFSIAILEALACGLPVLHHRYPVTQWITGSAGLAVDMEEPGAAARALDDFDARPDAPARLREAALALVRERYAPAVVNRQLADHFRRILALPEAGPGADLTR